MGKVLYGMIFFLTLYLNAVYEWKEGTYILSVEVLFFLFLFLQLHIRGGKISIVPSGKIRIAEEEEELIIPFTVTNKGKFGVMNLMFRIGKQKFCIRNIKAGTEQTVFCPYKAKECGRQELLPDKIRIRDPLGIFCKKVRNVQKEAAEIRVIPKAFFVFVEITKAVRVFYTESDEYAKDRGGDDTSEVFDVKTYQPGDKISKIHWKLSARSEELYIKQFSFPLGAAVVVFLNGTKKKRPKQDDRTFLRIVCSVGRAILDEECRYYVVWREKKNNQWTRRMIKDEQTYYEWLVMLAGIRTEEIDEIDEILYREEFHEPYQTALFLNKDLTICGTFQEKVQIHTEQLQDELGHTVLTV